jgi:hypothetical protein
MNFTSSGKLVIRTGAVGLAKGLIFVDGIEQILENRPSIKCSIYYCLANGN